MIRPYQEEDREFLRIMLLEENIKDIGMGFEDNETYVYDDGEVKGFYTYRIEHEIFPHLMHFCVRSDCRDMSVSRALIRDFRQRVKSKGYKFAYIHSKKSYLNKMVEWYFRIKPKHIEDGYAFYLVEA